MKQLLDSRLEALAFNYVSFGIFTIVNNIWTWVAVITAAVSFWRIRASGSAATSSCSITETDEKQSTSSIIDRAPYESRPILRAEAKPTPSALVSAPPAAVSEMSFSRLVCNDGVVLSTKGEKFKLTVYYEDDDDGDSDIDGEMTVTKWRSYGGGDFKSCGEWWESWERALSVRMGEKGWYRYLDLTAINGNVVSLWDEKPCRRGRYSSSCSVW